ncbi:DNA-binding transcriptional regulator ume6 [Sporothrix epigloea]|uniref:DNA-binding transcriptional regulator ume6 n=1 Tax=Sporothrix epigloea TaxID=1892477 RepID=A0ABP0DBC5_9PEZI
MATPSDGKTPSSMESLVKIKKAPAATKRVIAKSTTTMLSTVVSQPAKTKAASSTAAKTKPFAAAAGAGATRQKSSQTHRRSRTGCYTCRLRRKKCDEGLPLCTACKHLGLTCEYKRPSWWSNNDARRGQKDEIKIVIKQKKLAEKAASSIQTSIVGSPRGPSTSSLSGTPLPPIVLPKPVTFPHPLDRTRSASVDSQQPADDFNFNSPPTSTPDYGGVVTTGDSSSALSTPQINPNYMLGSGFVPYEVDVTTERQIFVNNVPTVHESTASSLSTYHAIQLPGAMLPPYLMYGDGTMVGEAAAGAPVSVDLDLSASCVDPQLTQPFTNDEWAEQVFPDRHEPIKDEPGLCAEPLPAVARLAHRVAIELDGGDTYLLEHFLQYVLPTLFPILEANQNGFTGANVVLPALQNNVCYLHSCLCVSAQHLKALLGSAQAQTEAQGLPAQLVATADLDTDIMRHRMSIVSALCNALPRDDNHQQVLESTLALIFFECSVGRFEDALPDVPWYHHFQAAATLAQKLNLTFEGSAASMALEETPLDSNGDAAALVTYRESQSSSFNMTLMSWVDILGATMLGCAPVFAHTYREKHLSEPHQSSLGLQELMGCEDRVMYLISEIACLEALKAGGMDDIMLCRHVSVLGDQIGRTEVGEEPAVLPFNANGTLNPKQLSFNITAAFRLAARIYLCSLIPGFCPSQASCRALVDKLTVVLQTIPCGPVGLDRCVVWAYLMAGFASMPCAYFRAFFADRVAQMGDNAGVGSFGRVVMLLHETWLQQSILIQQLHQEQQLTQHDSFTGGVDSLANGNELEQILPPQYVHWREVMQMKGWNFLLM